MLFENKKAIEDLACYLVRAPLSLQKLVYLDGHRAVLYRSRMNPSLGETSRRWTRSSGWPASPTICRRCGGPLRVVAYITDALAIRQILEHLDSSPPEEPPPEFRDVVRVPVDDEGREIELQPA